MSNLSIYESVRTVPKEALKEIQAGRMKGKSDINPMWRIKTLTEQFGPCGIGWKYAITKQWLEDGSHEQKSAFVNIDLFIKVDGQWSDAIPGTGGSSFIAKESSGLYTSDECFKMALTDAISVSCKALGIAADVYWNADKSKYDKPAPTKPTPAPSAQKPNPAPPQASTTTVNEQQLKRLFAISRAHNCPDHVIKTEVEKLGKKSTKELNKTEYDTICAFAENYKPNQADKDWQDLSEFRMPE
jgi:hypothetical protein